MGRLLAVCGLPSAGCLGLRHRATRSCYMFSTCASSDGSPPWRLQNSILPIVREPYIFKLEAGLVFQRMQFIAQATG